MSPGSITDLAQSDDIAFRVKFKDPVPQQAKLYWRALIFDTYDGHTWTHSEDQRPQTGKPDVSVRGEAVRYEVTQESTGQRWLFALDLPHALPVIQGNPVTFSKDMQTMALRPINDRVRYELASYPDYTLQAMQSKTALLPWLQLPINSNPKARAFANQLRGQSSDGAVLANSLLQYFHGQHFSYTLQPPLLGDDAIDEFLFSTQAGFCEHYAGAFVFLMRAMGVPARVVTGYQGGEINPVDGYLEVRQADAHAWAEIWLDQRGWVRYDPTAAVAPERVQKSLVSVIPRTTLGGLITLQPGKESILSKLRFNWEAVNNAWNQWVLNYSPEKQKSFLQSLGLKDVEWENMIKLMTIIGAAVVGLMSLPLMLNRQKKDPLLNVYLTLCQVMARAGYPREKHEGPRDYRLRLTADVSKLTPTRKNAVDRFLRLYESLRYADLQAQQSKSGFTQLKSLLSECK
jgi:transglutaminase-like putative cysteine protease